MTPAQKISRRKTRFKLFSPQFLLGRFLILVFLLLLAGATFKIYAAWQSRLWQTGRFTLVVPDANPTVYSIDPDQNRLTILEIPPNTQVTAARGYGEWLVGSLWQLGRQENLGGELLAASLRKSLALPAQGWLGEWGNLTSPTNLTFFDRLKLWQTLAQISAADQTKLDARTLRIIRPETLADGTVGFRVVPEQAEAVLASVFRDEAVFSEGKTVVVINTTQKLGMAGEVARLIRVLGARVIGTKTQGEPPQDCLIRGSSSELSSFTAQRLASLLSCPRQEGRVELGQLEIILGEAFARRF